MPTTDSWKFPQMQISGRLSVLSAREHVTYKTTWGQLYTSFWCAPSWSGGAPRFPPLEVYPELGKFWARATQTLILCSFGHFPIVRGAYVGDGTEKGKETPRRELSWREELHLCWKKKGKDKRDMGTGGRWPWHKPQDRDLFWGHTEWLSDQGSLLPLPFLPIICPPLPGSLKPLLPRKTHCLDS